MLFKAIRLNEIIKGMSVENGGRPKTEPCGKPTF